MSEVLRERGIPHEVLNARYIEGAAIVARAGRRVRSGRGHGRTGTDIMLGGNPEFEAEVELQERGIDPVNDPEIPNASGIRRLNAREPKAMTSTSTC